MKGVGLKLVSRLREAKVRRRLEDERVQQAAGRDRSKSLCVERLASLLHGYDPATLAARQLNLHNIQKRRASSAMWVFYLCFVVSTIGSAPTINRTQRPSFVFFTVEHVGSSADGMCYMQFHDLLKSSEVVISEVESPNGFFNDLLIIWVTAFLICSEEVLCIHMYGNTYYDTWR